VTSLNEAMTAQQHGFSEYADAAVDRAVVEQLSDGTFSAEVPGLSGVVAFAPNRHSVLDELRSVVGDWAALGDELGDELPDLSQPELKDRTTR
jgi:predicted RNase H-like HicB family nuclease